MAFAGRLHPLLIHFPIALVIAALAAEGAAVVTSDHRWRTVAVRNLRGGAVFAVLAALAGWRFAVTGGETSPLLEWHRWLGTIGACLTVAAALTAPAAHTASPFNRWTYRIALLIAAAVVAAAAHLGGVLVWGADFLHL
jgi:uncharacterized membrane protein